MRARTLIESVIRTADQAEEQLFWKDSRLGELQADIDSEVSVDR